MAKWSPDLDRCLHGLYRSPTHEVQAPMFGSAASGRPPRQHQARDQTLARSRHRARALTEYPHALPRKHASTTTHRRRSLGAARTSVFGGVRPENPPVFRMLGANLRALGEDVSANTPEVSMRTPLVLLGVWPDQLIWTLRLSANKHAQACCGHFLGIALGRRGSAENAHVVSRPARCVAPKSNTKLAGPGVLQRCAFVPCQLNSGIRMHGDGSKP